MFTVSPDQPDQQLDFCKNMLILNLMPARHFKPVGTGATQEEEILKNICLEHSTVKQLKQQL